MEELKRSPERIGKQSTQNFYRLVVVSLED